MGRFKLVLYHDGRRIEKPVTDPRKGVEALGQLKERGIRAKLVGRTENSLYPPRHSIKENLLHGKLWCPYCRDWTYFKVPKWTADAPVGSEAWARNVQATQSIRTCGWCWISEQDWYVKRANDLWGGPVKVRRRVRKRRS